MATAQRPRLTERDQQRREERPQRAERGQRPQQRGRQQEEERAARGRRRAAAQAPRRRSGRAGACAPRAAPRRPGGRAARRAAARAARAPLRTAARGSRARGRAGGGAAARTPGRRARARAPRRSGPPAASPRSWTSGQAAPRGQGNGLTAAPTRRDPACRWGAFSLPAVPSCSWPAARPRRARAWGRSDGAAPTLSPVSARRGSRTRAQRDSRSRSASPSGTALTDYKRGPGPAHRRPPDRRPPRPRAIIHQHPPIAADGQIAEPSTSRARAATACWSTSIPANGSAAQLPAPRRRPRRGHATGRAAAAVQADRRRRTATRSRCTAPKPICTRSRRRPSTSNVTDPQRQARPFTPWFGALAHAIFFRDGSLDYFHSHVCGPATPGCTSVLGGARVDGRQHEPGAAGRRRAPAGRGHVAAVPPVPTAGGSPDRARLR